MMMKHIFSTSALLIALSSIASAVNIPVPEAPDINASAYILMDHNTGKVVAEKNADETKDPASITKLMTAYVVYAALERDDISLNDDVLISEKAWRAIGSRMFIEVNKRVNLDLLLQGLIVQSGNDASIALAEHIAGDEASFADLMNHTARQLGLSNTHFVNATGLTDPEHYTTARDIALLSSAIIRDFPKEYKRYKQKQFTYNGIKQYNRNKLLWRDATVDGLKTGHTEAAKFCLASSALRENMRLISVVLGAPSKEARATQSQSLLNYGFRFYKTNTLYTAGQQLIEKRVRFGVEKQVSLGVAEDILVTTARSHYKNIKPSIELASEIVAPISKGQVLGTVRIQLGDETLAEHPLVALQDIAEGSWWQKLMDRFSRMTE
ncbi:D-alanyl-D-alanine carboxypeptidase [Gammaproteobacteria bacterium]|jgi:D-alanyl-D-alanine carboxypeptidase (penicillin-binding protein 5/6)|nr:D-alanyl-D-alanine carboxypeptidase [Gammaproteobacteria bacterium]